MVEVGDDARTTLSGAPAASPWSLFMHLLWRPGALPWAVLRCTGIGYLAMASACVLAEVVLLMVAAYAGIDEPYADMAAYLASVGRIVPRALLIATIVLAPAIFTLTLVISLGPPRAHTGGRLILYAPLVLFLPLLVWAPLAVLARVADPSFDLGTGKPAWAQYAALRLLAAPWGVLPFLAFIAALVSRAARHIPAAARREASGRACGACGYTLVGLDSTRCPECGVEIRGRPRLSDAAD